MTKHVFYGREKKGYKALRQVSHRTLRTHTMHYALGIIPKTFLRHGIRHLKHLRQCSPQGVHSSGCHASPSAALAPARCSTHPSCAPPTTLSPVHACDAQPQPVVAFSTTPSNPCRRFQRARAAVGTVPRPLWPFSSAGASCRGHRTPSVAAFLQRRGTAPRAPHPPARHDLL